MVEDERPSPGYAETLIPNVGVLWRTWGPAAASVIPADGSADLILLNDELVVAGPSTRAIPTRSSEAPVIGLRFEAGLAGRYLGRNPRELRDRGEAAGDALDPGRLARAERGMRALLPLASRASCRRDADRVELQALIRGLPAELGLEFIPADIVSARRIRSAARGDASGAETARMLGYSERQLRRRMDASFGYGFSELKRVMRVDRARRAIGAGIPLVEVAARTGYADQSHMTREFRVIAGATPAQFSGSAA